jgi:hypothetical protein
MFKLSDLHIPVFRWTWIILQIKSFWDLALEFLHECFYTFYNISVPNIPYMRFQILTAASMKITSFWDTASIIKAMKAVRTSETMVYFNETTWRHIPEGCHLHNTVFLKIYVFIYCFWYSVTQMWAGVAQVSVVSGYGLDDPAIEVRSPAEAKGFFLQPLCPDRLWGPPSLLSSGYWWSLPRA